MLVQRKEGGFPDQMSRGDYGGGMQPFLHSPGVRSGEQGRAVRVGVGVCSLEPGGACSFTGHLPSPQESKVASVWPCLCGLSDSSLGIQPDHRLFFR